MQKKTTAEQDGAVVVIDKYKKMSALLSTCIFSTKNVKRWLQMMKSDELFWIGFETVGSEYAFHPKPVATVGTSKNNFICSSVRLHVDSGNEPLWAVGLESLSSEVSEWAIEPGTWIWRSDGRDDVSFNGKSSPVTASFKEKLNKKIEEIK